MRHVSSTVLLFVCLAAAPVSHAQSTTLPLEEANNTSACSADGTPAYCDEALPALDTSSANQTAGAQTTTVDAFPVHVSTLPLKNLLTVGSQTYSGKILCEYQPWFSLQSGNNGHIDIGYDESNQQTVAGQDQNMINRGCNINFIDFYGSTESDQEFNETVTNTVYDDLKGRSGFPLQFAILEDEGAFMTECTDDNQTETEVKSCIETELEADMYYIHNTYIDVPNTSGLYWTDAATGSSVNVIGFFGACGDFAVNGVAILNCPGDWDDIWSAVSDYANSAPQNYNMEFIFEYGEFGYPTISAGNYAWPQPYTTSDCKAAKDCFTSDPASQFYWCDGTLLSCDGNYETGAYLDRFYHDASTYVPEGKIAVGLLDKGFDDSNAGWGYDRVTAQQCGQVLLDTAGEMSAGGYWGSGGNQLPYMQVATWNDYEEGTEEESGVNNCYSQVTLSYIQAPGMHGEGPTLSWSLAQSPAGNVGGVQYATANTINNFTIWYAHHNSNNISVLETVSGTTSFIDPFASDLPAGSYDFYVEMVGQPMIQNAMSNKQTISVE